MPATTILLVDSDRASADAVASALRSSGHDVAVAHDYNAARAGVAGRRVVILSGGGKRTRSLELCQQIRAEPATAALPILAIVPPDAAEERVRWFDAGADDVLERPFDPRELNARVDALLVRYARSQGLSGEPVPEGRRIIAFVGAKGGVGTTTAAVNVARAMAELRPELVVIVDADLQRGQVATHLNMTPRGSIADVVHDEQALRQPDVLAQYVERHSSGLGVLPAPAVPEPDPAVSADALRSILTNLTTGHEAVVVDAGSRIDDRTLMAVELANEVVFVLSPDIASLRAMKALVQGLGGTGASVSRTTFLLNHLYQQELLRRAEVEGVLGARIGFELPYDPVLYQKAVNQGVPLVRGAPDSAPAKAFRELGALLLRERSEDEPNGRSSGRRRGLAGVLKR